MKNWNEFIENISDEDMEQCIKDYELMKENGYIGGCVLRDVCRDWAKNVGETRLANMVMTDVVLEAYKRFAQKYFSMYNDGIRVRAYKRESNDISIFALNNEHLLKNATLIIDKGVELNGEKYYAF